MIVLDTNVICELMRPHGEPRVIAWIDQLPTSEIHLTAVTAAELRYGVARLPEGRRKKDLDARIEQSLTEDFAGRILPFDDRAAAHYAQIVTKRERRGLPINMADAQIAAICRGHGSGLVTRNTKDFAYTGVEVTDPWSATLSASG